METNELESGYNLQIEIESNLKFAQLGIGFKDDKNTSVTLRFRRLLSNHGKGLNPKNFSFAIPQQSF